MSRSRKIIIGVVITLIVLCGAFMLFVNWANSDSAQKAFKEIDTQQAIDNATASVQTQQASGTATALWDGINERLANAQLVFEEDFDEKSAFLAKNAGDMDPYFRDGIPEIIVAWNGYHIWPIQKNLKDFVAETDCYASGAFCGVAYGMHLAGNSSGSDVFYASSLGGSTSCGFDDHTGSYSSSRGFYCGGVPSTTGNGMYHLRVERFGSILRFYVNGKLMDERTLDNPNAASGDVGFYFGKASDDTGIQYMQVDSFKVWELP